MAYFPNQIMPKNLAQETSSEVDNSPCIYNARDYNTHVRELIAIQKYLVGDGLSSSSGNYGIINLIGALIEAFENLSKNGIISQTSGVVSPGSTIPLPSGLINTITTGNVAKADVAVAVVSVVGFPTSGYITKFNSIKTAPPGAPFGIKSIHSQEVISYTSLDTSGNRFLGCTRAVQGTAQDATAGEPAIVVAGRASVFLAHKGWQATVEKTPELVYIDHNAALVVSSDVYDAVGTIVDANREVIYSLTVAGAFDNIQVEEPAI